MKTAHAQRMSEYSQFLLNLKILDVINIILNFLHNLHHNDTEENCQIYAGLLTL